MHAEVQGIDQLRWSDRLRRRARRALRSGPPFDVGVAIERLPPSSYLEQARRWALVVHPEWLTPATTAGIAGVDLLLCKTHEAEQVLTPLGRPLAYTGWTTHDRQDPRIPRAVPPFALHVGGSSGQKGTNDLIAVWGRHPEWPRLEVVSWVVGEAERELAKAAPNITLHDTFLSPDGALKRLMNAATWHLCPSEAEGYGHTIVEAMSCGRVVLTTDAAPMNELVRPDRGILVRPGPGRPQHYGTRYRVDHEALEAAITAMLAGGEAHTRALCSAARQWYLEADRQAQRRIMDALRRLA